MEAEPPPSGPEGAERAFTGPIFDVDRERWSGIPHPYDVVHVRHGGAAAVLPITPGGEVLLVRQLRPPIRRPIVEIPAGLLDVDGEDPLACAARELFEETGYRHETIEFLGGCFSSPGLTDEYVHVFLARTPAEPEGEPEPGIELVRMPFEDALRSARSGRLSDAKTALAILLAEARGVGPVG